MYKTGRYPEQQTTTSWELRSKSLTAILQTFVRTVQTSCERHSVHLTDSFIATTNNESVRLQTILKHYEALPRRIPVSKYSFQRKCVLDRDNTNRCIFMFIPDILNNKCSLYTNLCTNKYCKFILNYSEMFRC